ncbi:MAG: DUF1684 domain-containing protein [Cyclobacteriaceae bacterium]
MSLKPLAFLLFLLTSCSRSVQPDTQDLNDYTREINEWHHTRVELLLSETGWINLAGLFWLNEGVNSFGTESENDLQFPEGSADKLSGYFILSNGRVTVKIRPEADILINGMKATEAEVYAPENMNSVMSSGTFRWNVIRREDKFGIRLRDLSHPALKNFKGVERFEINHEYKIRANLQTSDTLKTIAITNVLGQTTQQKSPGTAIFEFNGKSYSLDLIDEGTDGEYFIIFSDLTNGETTYESGRFLYVTHPDSKGNMIIDFNKSINPPCAFSPYATCPLPPPQNRLNVPIDAGEKNVHLY